MVKADCQREHSQWLAKEVFKKAHSRENLLDAIWNITVGTLLIVGWTILPLIGLHIEPSKWELLLWGFVLRSYFKAWKQLVKGDSKILEQILDKADSFILYLRPFKEDNRRSVINKEALLVHHLEKLGPVIALGKPHEKIPPIGTTRVYVKEEKWQEVILKIMPRMRLVVISLAVSESLWWEVTKAIKNVKPQRLLLLLMNESYSDNSTIFQRLDRILPCRTDNPRNFKGQSLHIILHFKADWTPLFVKLDERKKLHIQLEEAFKPVVEKKINDLIQLEEAFKPVVEKKINDLPITVSRQTSSQLAEQLKFSERDVKSMLQRCDFYSTDRYDWAESWSNPGGKGIANDFSVQQDGETVYDAATGLTWQQASPPEEMNFGKAQEYIRTLNDVKYAGHSDWRLPTLEEAMSLMEPKKKKGDLHIDPVFDSKQGWIWTSDKESDSRTWCVSFGGGYCFSKHISNYFDTSVRAVR